MLSQFFKYYHTLRYLKWRQIKYRLWYWVRTGNYKTQKLDANYGKNKTTLNKNWQPSIFGYTSYLGNNQFVFLNCAHQFNNQINWNEPAHGKLWTYNLNYFEYLGQPQLSKSDGLKLIHQWLDQETAIKDGLEPYPISLRVIFWIKFLLQHRIDSIDIDHSLSRQLTKLSARPEYHLLGNHLLENGFALLFGGQYLNQSEWIMQGKQIISTQLAEQILSDGGHFELSPMYHQIIIYRLLDILNLLAFDPKNSFYAYIKQQTAKMLGWLQEITFRNGDVPQVNDSTSGIGPTNDQIFAYAERLDVKPESVKLEACGYRKWTNKDYELLMDLGNIGPDYIPGHAHSDTFSFVLYHQELPIIVDTGISTYEKNTRRHQERTTAAHNTVMIKGIEQSEVWGGFRVARRAKILAFNEAPDLLEATHDGYQRLGIKHTRSFKREGNKISIADHLSQATDAQAFLHFHPAVQITLEGFKITGDFGEIIIKNAINITTESYELALGFNKTTTARKVVIAFKQHLQTEIILR